MNLSTKPFTALYNRFEDFEDLEDFKDPTYLINQLYYTDHEATINDYHSEVTRGRQNWLQEAYRDFLPTSGGKPTPLINNLFDTATLDDSEAQKLNPSSVFY